MGRGEIPAPSFSVRRKMYEETKKAVKKAFQVGKIIFSLGPDRYSQLLKAVGSVRHPTHKDLKPHIDDGLCLEDALITELKYRYMMAASQAGFTKRQGLAMLEYAAMLEELKE
jgi:hypothetical protein